MADVFGVVDVLVGHIKAKWADDIAIVGYYGSYAQGTQTKRSDVDIFFIPATSEGLRAGIQFVLDGIGIDFWPISWKRAERMASFEDPKTTIIADCVLVYARSEEDRVRFMKLRDTIFVMQEAEQGRMLMEKAEQQLREACEHVYKMSRLADSENMSDYRMEARGVMTNVLQSIALLNRTYLATGWGKNMDQIMRFSLKPAELEALLDAIMNAKRAEVIVSACEQLAMDTLELILEHKKTYSGAPSYPDRMKGFYEETKGTLDKIVTACESNDYRTAFYAATGVQDEIARFLYYAERGDWPGRLEPYSSYRDVYQRLGFPDLAALLDPRDLAPLQAAVEQLDDRLEAHLRAQGVALNQFQTIRQLEAFLNSRE